MVGVRAPWCCGRNRNERLSHTVFSLASLCATGALTAGYTVCLRYCGRIVVDIDWTFRDVGHTLAYVAQMDEMASYHDGWATTVSYHVAFMLVGIGCVLSLVRGFEVDLGAGCLMLMGIAMVAHGVTFAVLEKEEVYADYQDA